MKNILNKISLYCWTKKRLSAALVVFAVAGALLGQTFLPLTAFAADPQFNIFTPYSDTAQTNQDYYMLRAKNDTTGTSFTSGTTAASGNDIITFYFYYHNGVIDSVANNTRLRVTLPSVSGFSQYVTAYLSADNANSLSQSVPISLGQQGSLEYIAGSAQWFPNHVDWRTTSPTAFPSGQTGDQLFTSGINIGSIQGCWPYTGAIVFRARVLASTTPTPTPSYSLAIQKMVANATSGGGFAENVNAQNNDRVTFQIRVTNNSNTYLSNVNVRDQLPSNLNYVSGSTRLDGSYTGDGLISGGISLGQLSAGQSRTVTFDATVNMGYYNNYNYYNYGYYNSYPSATITNYAYASSYNTSEVSDTASVYVSGQSQNGYLNVYKYVRNITQNQNTLTTTTNANQGETVLFSIQISVPVGQVNNVRVWDVLPSGLNYVSGSARLDNGVISDSLISGGVNIGTVSANQSRTLTLQATVNSNVVSQTLTNTVFTNGDNVSQQSATAQVVVGGTVIQPSGFTKAVSNITSPNGTNTDNTASAGHTLQYTLSYTNTTGNILNNVRMIDTLPSYTSFISASNSGIYTASNNQIVWNLGSLGVGSSVSVTYQARVQTPPTNNFVITNSALMTGDNMGQLVSNETHTTVIGVVLGATIQAVTGGDDLTRNLAISLMLSIFGIMILYFAKEYPIFWRKTKLNFVAAKIRLKEFLS
jgi:uncharacterized repeat protein (TIGR01451 family)